MFCATFQHNARVQRGSMGDLQRGRGRRRDVERRGAVTTIEADSESAWRGGGGDCVDDAPVIGYCHRPPSGVFRLAPFRILRDMV